MTNLRQPVAGVGSVVHPSPRDPNLDAGVMAAFRRQDESQRIDILPASCPRTHKCEGAMYRGGGRRDSIPITLLLLSLPPSPLRRPLSLIIGCALNSVLKYSSFCSLRAPFLNASARKNSFVFIKHNRARSSVYQELRKVKIDPSCWRSPTVFQMSSGTFVEFNGVVQSGPTFLSCAN